MNFHSLMDMKMTKNSSVRAVRLLLLLFLKKMNSREASTVLTQTVTVCFWQYLSSWYELTQTNWYEAACTQRYNLIFLCKINLFGINYTSPAHFSKTPWQAKWVHSKKSGGSEELCWMLHQKKSISSLNSKSSISGLFRLCVCIDRQNNCPATQNVLSTQSQMGGRESGRVYEQLMSPLRHRLLKWDPILVLVLLSLNCMSESENVWILRPLQCLLTPHLLHVKSTSQKMCVQMFPLSSSPLYLWVCSIFRALVHHLTH